MESKLPRLVGDGMMILLQNFPNPLSTGIDYDLKSFLKVGEFENRFTSENGLELVDKHYGWAIGNLEEFRGMELVLAKKKFRSMRE